MEDFLERFPEVGEEIFKQLDNQSLAKCREVSRSQFQFFEDNKVLWRRMIEKFSANNLEFKNAWKLVVERVPVQNVKELAIAVEQFYSFHPNRIKHQHSPHHIAADRGSLSLCKFIFERTRLLNPARADGFTALHFAAEQGHFDVCEYLIKYLDGEDKNPKDKDGCTPMYLAVRRGHNEICKVFIDLGANPNPTTNEGRSALEDATISGQFETFKLIMETQNEKNPLLKNWDGRTLLHLAASNGHLDIFRYIIAQGLETVSPRDDSGCTPLHDAAYFGELEIVKCIMDKLEDKNPKNLDGETPMHLAVQEGDYEMCKVIINHGADPNPTDNEGISALDQANYDQIRDLILKTQRKEN